MSKMMTRLILILTIILMVSGCAGLSNYNNSRDYDDGFYHWGKGKNDRGHSY
jgi:hypothetical protein